MNTFIIAKEQVIADTHTIINFQGKPGQKYVVSYQFSAKPKRAKFAEGWPTTPDDNRIRLSEAGIVMDGLVQKCTNCQELGHISKNCSQERQESAAKVAITCANVSTCFGTDIRVLLTLSSATRRVIVLVIALRSASPTSVAAGTAVLRSTW